MKRVLKKLIWLMLIVGLGVFGWRWFESKKKKGAEKPEYVAATIGTIEDAVEATGEVTPLNRVEVKPPISGRIEKILVEEGARVKAGQTLAWMSSSDRAAIMDAARAQSDAERRHWEDAYKPTPIIAPLSGVVILKNVVVGQTVEPSTILYAMSDRLIVLAQVDEADIGRVKVGLPSRITLDAYPEESIEGKVFQILYEGKNVSNVITYGVKIEPKNVPPFFRAQMTANVSLILKKNEAALLIPSVAIRNQRSGEKEVMMPGPEGKPVSKVVETGIESGESVEITAGLQEGDQVLVSRTKYTPQKGVQNSPLGMGNRRPQSGTGTGSGGGGRRTQGS